MVPFCGFGASFFSLIVVDISILPESAAISSSDHHDLAALSVPGI
jgi:hypothetical protein